MKVPLKSLIYLSWVPDSQVGSPVVITFLCCSYYKGPPFVYFFLIFWWLPNVPPKSFTPKERGRTDSRSVYYSTSGDWKRGMKRGKIQVWMFLRHASKPNTSQTLSMPRWYCQDQGYLISTISYLKRQFSQVDKSVNSGERLLKFKLWL